MAEREQFESEVRTTANDVTEDGEKGDEDGIHPPTLAQSRATAKSPLIRRCTEYSERTGQSCTPNHSQRVRLHSG
jgi:hypothetical protein